MCEIAPLGRRLTVAFHPLSGVDLTLIQSKPVCEARSSLAIQSPASDSISWQLAQFGIKQTAAVISATIDDRRIIWHLLGLTFIKGGVCYRSRTPRRRFETGLGFSMDPKGCRDQPIRFEIGADILQRTLGPAF